MAARWLRPHVRLGTRRASSFQVCAVAGLAVANVVAVFLADGRGLSVGAIAGMDVVTVGCFLGLAMATKVALGEERLTFYHHALAVVVATAAVWALLDRPVLAALDVLAIGLTTFLAFGRIGCLLVGCCHGRPARRGITYGPEQVAAGFPATYAGVPLVPVQALEAASAAPVVGIGIALVAAGAGAGVPFVVVLTAHAFVRFILEEKRGDVRPRGRGLSEAQWTSALVALFTIVGGQTELLPRTLPTVALAASVLVLAFTRALSHQGAVAERRRLRSPEHVTELVRLLRDLAAAGGPMVTGATSLGVHVSHSEGEDGVPHWAVSWRGRPLSRRDVQFVVSLVQAVAGRRRALTVVEGTSATHLVGAPPRAPRAQDAGASSASRALITSSGSVPFGR